MDDDRFIAAGPCNRFPRPRRTYTEGITPTFPPDTSVGRKLAHSASRGNRTGPPHWNRLWVVIELSPDAQHRSRRGILVYRLVFDKAEKHGHDIPFHSNKIFSTASSPPRSATGQKTPRFCGQDREFAAENRNLTPPRKRWPILGHGIRPWEVHSPGRFPA